MSVGRGRGLRRRCVVLGVVLCGWYGATLAQTPADTVRSIVEGLRGCHTVLDAELDEDRLRVTRNTDLRALYVANPPGYRVDINLDEVAVTSYRIPIGTELLYFRCTQDPCMQSFQLLRGPEGVHNDLMLGCAEHSARLAQAITDYQKSAAAVGATRARTASLIMREYDRCRPPRSGLDERPTLLDDVRLENNWLFVTYASWNRQHRVEVDLSQARMRWIAQDNIALFECNAPSCMRSAVGNSAAKAVTVARVPCTGKELVHLLKKYQATWH